MGGTLHPTWWSGIQGNVKGELCPGRVRTGEGGREKESEGRERKSEGPCHTLKYLILGCEYLSEFVHLSIGFFKNFPDFSGD
jgi:hypothetical protein